MQPPSLQWAVESPHLLVGSQWSHTIVAEWDQRYSTSVNQGSNQRGGGHQYVGVMEGGIQTLPAYFVKARSAILCGVLKIIIQPSLFSWLRGSNTSWKWRYCYLYQHIGGVSCVLPVQLRVWSIGWDVSSVCSKWELESWPSWCNMQGSGYVVIVQPFACTCTTFCVYMATCT